MYDRERQSVPTELLMIAGVYVCHGAWTCSLDIWSYQVTLSIFSSDVLLLFLQWFAWCYVADQHLGLSSRSLKVYATRSQIGTNQAHARYTIGCNRKVDRWSMKSIAVCHQRCQPYVN